MNDYAARQEARKERLEKRAALCTKLANIRYTRASEMASIIPFGQPILVGHHSEGRDQRYRAKIERNWRKARELADKAKYYAERAASVGKAGISSDDPEAVTKLQEQIEKAEELQARMTAANKAVRGNDREALAAQGFDALRIQALFTPDFCGRLGFPNYQLTNNSANIRRMKQRVEQLRREVNRPAEPEVETANGIRIVENKDLNRLQLFFPGKPAEEIRRNLKAHGFRWSPSEGAWQRQLHESARWAAKNVLSGILSAAVMAAGKHTFKWLGTKATL